MGFGVPRDASPGKDKRHCMYSLDYRIEVKNLNPAVSLLLKQDITHRKHITDDFSRPTIDHRLIAPSIKIAKSFSLVDHLDETPIKKPPHTFTEFQKIWQDGFCGFFSSATQLPENFVILAREMMQNCYDQ